MKSYISYNLFRNRTKFNPLSLFISNNNMTYEEFKVYFNSRDIESPDITYYNRVKDKFKETLENKTKDDVEIEEEKIPVIKKQFEKQKKQSKKKSKKFIEKKVIKDENN